MICRPVTRAIRRARAGLQDPNRPIGVFSTFFPAKSAQIEVSGRFAPGEPPKTR